MNKIFNFACGLPIVGKLFSYLRTEIQYHHYNQEDDYDDDLEEYFANARLEMEYYGNSAYGYEYSKIF